MENNTESNWTCPVSVVTGRNVVRTQADGTANYERVVEMTDNIISRGKGFSGKWAYMPHISKLNPVLDEDTRKAFTKLHERCLAAGCSAFAFVTGGSVSAKVQSKRHHNASKTEELVNEYFRTEEEALEWLESIGI